MWYLSDTSQESFSGLFESDLSLDFQPETFEPYESAPTAVVDGTICPDMSYNLEVLLARVNVIHHFDDWS
jgi:hypothetical protein